MSNSPVSVSFDKESLRKIGIIFNSKRPEYNDLRPYWKSKELQSIMGNYFKDMFESSNQGKWHIKPETVRSKLRRGLDPRPNIETGAMSFAMIREKGTTTKGVSGQSFSASLSLRLYNKQSMTWGVNTKDRMFATKQSPYPFYAAAKNGFATVSEQLADDIGNSLGEYMIKKMQEIAESRV